MDPYSVPWPVALTIAGGLTTTVGVLWKRLVDKEDEHQRRYIELSDRYHSIVVLIHQAIELKASDNGRTP